MDTSHLGGVRAETATCQGKRVADLKGSVTEHRSAFQETLIVGYIDEEHSRGDSWRAQADRVP
jgi:hypothetical protein